MNEEVIGAQWHQEIWTTLSYLMTLLNKSWLRVHHFPLPNNPGRVKLPGRQVDLCKIFFFILDKQIKKYGILGFGKVKILRKGEPCDLTHWGRVTHICVSKLTIIVSDNGLSPGRRQATIWTNAGILLSRPLRTNFSEILIRIKRFSFKKMHFKMSSAKWRPFCLGLNELMSTGPLGTFFSEIWIKINCCQQIVGHLIPHCVNKISLHSEPILIKDTWHHMSSLGHDDILEIHKSNTNHIVDTTVYQ